MAPDEGTNSRYSILDESIRKHKTPKSRAVPREMKKQSACNSLGV